MRAFLIGASVLALSACSGSDDPRDPVDPDDPTDPTPDDPDDPNPDDPIDHEARDYDDVATTIGASARVGEFAVMLDMMVISHGGMPADVQYHGQVGGHFHHATSLRNGINFDYLYHCNDNADAIVPVCNNTIDHSHFTVKLSGDAVGAMEMNGLATKGGFTVRDIDIVKPRVGGTDALDFTARVNNADYVFAFDTAFDRVRFEPNGVIPLSGKIDFTIAANRNRAGVVRDFTMSGSLVFAGSNTATLTLDATKNYSVDLATGAVVAL